MNELNPQDLHSIQKLAPVRLGFRDSMAIGHLQTVLGHVLPSHSQVLSEESSPIQFKQGARDFGCLHFSNPKEPLPFVMVLFHGLAGHSDSDYMRRLADVALSLNIRVVRVDHRGSGSVVSQFTEPYHSGRGQDASDVINLVRSKYADHKIIACGISMSGTILLNLLSKRFGSDQPDFGITVNAPLDLADAAIRLKSGASRLYDLRFFYKLKKLIEQKDKDTKLPWIGTTELIDGLYTSVRSGFVDRKDYYKKCSPFSHVSLIDKPCFIITAKDDPFVDFEFYKKAEWSRLAEVIVQDNGGHVGYISKTNLSFEGVHFGRRWLDYCIYRILRKIINDQAI